MIKDRLARFQEEIVRICQRCGRNPQEITLVGVTKWATVKDIEEALSAGLHHIGENRVQQAKEKFPSLHLREPTVTKHMIGHLQTNKVKAALSLFDMIQSVDNLQVAKEMDEEADKAKQTIDLLIQVNTSGESQKFGLPPIQTSRLLQAISEFKNLRTLGLMTMAPLTDNQVVIRHCFAQMWELREQLSKHWGGHPRIDLKYLSMGMTNDYPIAIEEGANMLRIGRAIFGKDK